LKRAELDDFLARHGGISIAGDGPNGPSYITEDGWTVRLPLDRPDVMEVASPYVCDTCGHRHTHDGGGYCGFRESWVGLR
jgi:hypothetical protein